MGRFAAVRNFIVGVVFLGSLVAVGYVTIQVTGGVWGDNEDVTVPFDRVNGLKIGDEVRIFGYRVGKVRDIRLDVGLLPAAARALQGGEKEYPVDVTIRLPREVVDRLPAATSFLVKSSGPLGGSYIEIQTAPKGKKAAPAAEKEGGPGRTGAAPRGQTPVASPSGRDRDSRRNELASVPLIPPAPTSFLLPVAEAQEAGKGAAEGPAAGGGAGGARYRGSASPELMEELGALIDENRDNIRRIVEEIREAMDSIRAQRGILGSLIENGDMRDRLGRFLENAEAISLNLRQGKGTLGRILNDDKLANDIEDIVGRVKTIVADVEAGKGTIGALLRDEALARKITDSVEHFKEVVGKINDGVGTAGQLVNNREAWDRIVFVLRQVQEAVEDFREQAPINSFVNAIFTAF